MRAALLIALVTGCAVNFDPGTTRFSCEDGVCPNGQTCINQVCQSSNLDASIDAADGALPCLATSHLVLSEVNVTPDVLEYIEISNPTNGPLDLTDVYISDDQDYALTPAFAAGNQTSMITSSDFIYRFPDGELLPAFATLTIAFNGASFMNQFGVPPDLTLDDMIRIEPQAGGTPALNNSGEALVLFQWDGATDRVTDLDAVVWGDPVTADDLVGKTGISVDGPDADALESTYLPDAASAPPLAIGQTADSIHRLQGEGGREDSPGNGVANEDETSEPLDQTWGVRANSPGAPAFCNP